MTYECRIYKTVMLETSSYKEAWDWFKANPGGRVYGVHDWGIVLLLK